MVSFHSVINLPQFIQFNAQLLFPVFFTGSAGCGKSFLLHNIIRLLPKDTTAVTSSTGISAVQIHGSTLHNWVGVNILDLTTAEAKTYIFKSCSVG